MCGFPKKLIRVPPQSETYTYTMEETKNTSIIPNAPYLVITDFVLKGGVVVWIVFSIISLVQESNTQVQDACGNSYLWFCLCTMTVLNGCNLLLNLNRSNDEESKGNLFIACLSIAGFIWMAVELFAPCPIDKLRELRVWKLLAALFGFELAIIGLLLFAGCVVCLAKLNSKNTDEPQEFV